MEQYSFELKFWKEQFDNFKQKSADVLISAINGCMLNQHLNFIGYGKVEFDKNDFWHKTPNITVQNEFIRNKVNCLVFDVFNASYDNYEMPYNKLFIYYTEGKNESYGFVFYNTITNDVSHVFFIEYLYDELCKRIHSAFNTFSRVKMLNEYAKKYNEVKGNKRYRSDMFITCK